MSYVVVIVNGGPRDSSVLIKAASGELFEPKKAPPFAASLLGRSRSPRFDVSKQVYRSGFTSLLQASRTQEDFDDAATIALFTAEHVRFFIPLVKSMDETLKLADHYESDRISYRARLKETFALLNRTTTVMVAKDFSGGLTDALSAEAEAILDLLTKTKRRGDAA